MRWRGEVSRGRRRWNSTHVVQPPSCIRRRAGVRVECPRVWRGRERSTIRIRRRRFSTTPWRGVVAIIWSRGRGRLVKRKRKQFEV